MKTKETWAKLVFTHDGVCVDPETQRVPKKQAELRAQCELYVSYISAENSHTSLCDLPIRNDFVIRPQYIFWKSRNAKACEVFAPPAWCTKSSRTEAACGILLYMCLIKLIYLPDHIGLKQVDNWSGRVNFVFSSSLPRLHLQARAQWHKHNQKRGKKTRCELVSGSGLQDAYHQTEACLISVDEVPTHSRRQRAQRDLGSIPASLMRSLQGAHEDSSNVQETQQTKNWEQKMDFCMLL